MCDPQTVEEDETVLAFAFALRKQATAGMASKAKPKPVFGVPAKGKYK